MALHQIDNSEPLLAPGSDRSFMITWDKDERPAYPSDMIRLFLNNFFRMPTPEKTMADSHHALRVYDVIKPDDEDITPKVLKFEDADHVWLAKVVEDHASVVIGVMAARLRDALQPMSVSEKRKKNKTDKEAEDEEPGD